MKRKYIFRGIILLAIIGIYFIFNYHQCFILKFIAFPKILKMNNFYRSHNLLFLYGANICRTCPTGEFINSIGQKANIIYVVPDSFSIYDIDNLRYAFDMKGKIVKGGIEINVLLKKILSCLKVGDSKKSIYLEIGRNNKIKKIMVI